jgi:hypothetical protein
MKEVIDGLLYDTNEADLILTDNGSKVIYGSFDTSSVQHYKIDLYISPNKRFFKIHQKGYEKYTNFFCTKTTVEWSPSYLYPLTAVEAYNQFMHLITSEIKNKYFDEIQNA